MRLLVSSLFSSKYRSTLLLCRCTLTNLNSFKALALVALLLALPDYVLANKPTLNVAVAANFRHASEEIFSAYTLQTNQDVKPSYGSTGKLIVQIEHGAPYDIFISADTLSYDYLKNSKLVIEGSEFVYALGQLALWHPSGFLAEEHKLNLSLLSPQILSIANPKLAPYGKAAQQALPELERLGLKIKRTLTGQSISQAYQFVASGNASIGLVSLSQVIAGQQPKNTWHLVPEQFYEPIRQKAFALKNLKGNQSYLELLSFLRSDKARDIMRKYGYRFDQIKLESQ